MPDPWDIAGGLQSGMKTQDMLVQKAGEIAAGKALMSLYQGAVPGAQPMQGAPPPGGSPQGGGIMPQPPQASGNPPQQPMPAGWRPPMAVPVPGAQPMGGLPGQAPTPQQPPQQGMQQPQQGGQGGAQGPLDWKSVVQQVVKANPGADPRVIMTAVNHFLPLMTQQAQMEWKQVMLAQRQQGLGIQQERADTQREQGGERIGIAQQQADTSARRANTQASQGQQRIDLGNKREERLTGSTQVRQDQGWQRLELQKQALQQRVQESGDKRLLSQWRAVLDAQHKRAMEIIQANALGSGLGDKEKKKLLDEEDKAYTDAIKQMRDGKPPGAAQQDSEKIIDVKTPADAEKLPKGTHYRKPDGEVYVR